MSATHALMVTALLAASGAARGSGNVRRGGGRGPNWDPPKRAEIVEMVAGGATLEEIQDMYHEYVSMPPSSERRVAVLLDVDDGRVLLVQDEDGAVQMQEIR